MEYVTILDREKSTNCYSLKVERDQSFNWEIAKNLSFQVSFLKSPCPH